MTDFCRVLSETRCLRAILKEKLEEMCGILNEAFKTAGIPVFARVEDFSVAIIGSDTDSDGERLWVFLDPDTDDIIKGGSMRISLVDGQKLRNILYGESE